MLDYESRTTVITFNDVLRSADVDPGKVRLARHQDTRARGRSIYEIWKEPGGQAIVEEYQAIQRRPAGFVVSPPPGKETVFIGLYAVRGLRRCQAGRRDPITEEDVTGYNLYELELDHRLDECREHLVADWGPGYRTWVQHGLSNPKPVLAAPPVLAVTH